MDRAQDHRGMVRTEPAPDGLSQVRVTDLLEAVSSVAPVPGGGGVCAAAAALAAALAGMAGRYALRRTPGSARFAGLVERVDQLRVRAAALWDADGEAYGQYVQASRLPRQPDEGGRAQALADASEAAARVPLELAELAAEVARIGEELATTGNPNLRSDAAIATCLVAATAVGAAVLVRDNLRSSADDPRVVDAQRFAADAVGATSRVATALGLRLTGVGSS